MNVFFHPDSIAVIGASEALTSFGARYIQALLDIGYEGTIYAVNHSGKEVLGHKIYRSILDIPARCRSSVRLGPCALRRRRPA